MNRRTFEYLYDKFIIHLNYALKLQLFSHITNIFTFFFVFFEMSLFFDIHKVHIWRGQKQFFKKIGQPKKWLPYIQISKMYIAHLLQLPNQRNFHKFHVRTSSHIQVENPTQK